MKEFNESAGVPLVEAAERTGKTENSLLRMVVEGKLSLWVWSKSSEMLKRDFQMLDEGHNLWEKTGWLQIPGEVAYRLIRENEILVDMFIRPDGMKVFPASIINEPDEVVYIESDFMGISCPPKKTDTWVPEYGEHEIRILRDELCFSPEEIGKIFTQNLKGNMLDGGIEINSSREILSVSQQNQEANKTNSEYNQTSKETNSIILATLLEMVTSDTGFTRYKNQGKIIDEILRTKLRDKKTLDNRFSKVNTFKKSNFINPVFNSPEEKRDYFLMGFIKDILQKDRVKRAFMTVDEVIKEISGLNYDFSWLEMETIKNRFQVARADKKRVVENQKIYKVVIY